MKSVFALILFAACFACSQQSGQPSGPADPIEAVKEKEMLAGQLNYDDLGELVATIPFAVETTDKENFEDGIIPWASLENPAEDIPHLINRDDIVIPQSTVTIIIDYPLNHPYRFTMTAEKGFSRRQLLEEISKNYYNVFEEEENTATIKTIPIADRTTMYNRNETNGKYGIWGHDIADLDLSEIYVYQAGDGQIFVVLGVES